MRKLLGALVLGAGVAGLGVWGAGHQAKTMQAEIGQEAAQVVQASVHGVQARVSGRDITVSGYADSEAERENILTALNAVDGRRVVRDEMVVLPVAAPFTFEAEKSAQGLALSGHVPSEGARKALGAGAEALTLAAGAPVQWSQAATAALAALGPLDAGAVALRDAQVIVTGQAATPVEKQASLAALSALPEGYGADVVIEVADDGQPDFDLSYDAATGMTLEGGKLPKGLSRVDVAQALGVSDVAGDLPTTFGEDADALGALRALGDWAPEFDSLRYSRVGGNATLEGDLLPGVDGELVAAGLTAALPGATVTLAETTRLPDEGTLRVNARTGLREVFTSGFWLPQVDFTPSLESCTAQAGDILEKAKINFVTGSARLGARSVRAVNALASVLRSCTAEGGLTLELGGHTDNTGDPAANMVLSAERAQAVRDALVARGIAPEAVTAAGFGASQPIADNTTEEGRAANRRTTITWSTDAVIPAME